MSLLTILLPFITIFCTLRHATSTSNVPGLRDLEDFTELYTGEFSNQRQNSEDVANNISFPELHFLLHYYTVPVRVNALQVEGEESRQIYLEQYYNNGDTPSRQRIYNVRLLDDGSLETSTYQYQNDTALESFRDWQNDRSVFEDLQADLLTHDPLCNFIWSRDGPALFTTRSNGTNCQFVFMGTLVYVDSEVDVKEEAVIQDEKFIRVSDGVRMAGTTLPYVFDRIGDVPPLSSADSSATCGPVTSLACVLSTVTWLLLRHFPLWSRGFLVW